MQKAVKDMLQKLKIPMEVLSEDTGGKRKNCNF